MKLSTFIGFTMILFLGFGVAFQAEAQEVAQDEIINEDSKSKKKNKKKKRDKAEKTVSYLTLADLLRRQPGVMVQGSGNNAKVAIRGGSGPSGVDPLYVLDRVPVGNSLAQVSGMVDVNDIADINVLSGADASQYGTRGNSGVIEITTKKE
jgi:TonB-dependent SusC/RagA subfamily outer membrane receptor